MMADAKIKCRSCGGEWDTYYCDHCMGVIPHDATGDEVVPDASFEPEIPQSTPPPVEENIPSIPHDGDPKGSDAHSNSDASMSAPNGNWGGLEWEDMPDSRKSQTDKARIEQWVLFLKQINDLPSGSTLTEVRLIVEAAWKSGYRRPDELATLRGVILARKHNLIGVTASAVDNTIGDIAAAERNALRASGGDWQARLDRTKDGVALSNEHNAGIAIHALYGRNLYYDSFSGQIWGKDDSGIERPLKNVNYAEVVIAVQEFGYPQAKKSHVADALEIITRRYAKSRLVEQLNSFQWDGVERASTWLQAYCGVEDTRYYRMCGRYILLQAVARAFKPGSKCDLMPILIGDQGLMKSTLWRTVSLDHYLEFDQNFMTRDGMMQMLGKWFVDWAELVALSRREATEAKGFQSRLSDKFRMPYDRLDEEHPRQFVLVGTANPEPFLKDITGSRRYMCLESTRINLQALQNDITQIWAEAVAMFRHGLLWFPKSPGAGDDWFYAAQITSNKKWQIAGADPWFTAIEHFIWHDYRLVTSDATGVQRVDLTGERVEPRGRTPGAEWLLQHVCGVPVERQNQPSKNRVAGIMKYLNYEATRLRDLEDGQGGTGAPKPAYVRAVDK